LQTKGYDLKWTTCSALPTQMYDASVAVDSTSVYVTACATPENEDENSVYCYDVKFDNWSTLPPSGHHRGILCLVDSMLCIFGGEDPVTGEVLSKVSTYTNDTKQWSRYYNDMIHERYLPGVITQADSVIVMGGDSRNGHLKSIEIMNWKERSQWRESFVTLPTPMWNIKPVISGKNLLIVGYDHSDGRQKRSIQIPVTTITLPEKQSQAVIPDFKASYWKEFSPAPHWNTATVPSSNPPLIIGGANHSSQGGVPTTDISFYDATNDSWAQTSVLSSAKDCVGIGVINRYTLIVLGGTSGAIGFEEAKEKCLSVVEIGYIIRN